MCYDIVFVLHTESNNNVPCESSADEVDNGTIIDDPIPHESPTDTNNDNGPSESPTSATEMPNNTTVDNDDDNDGSDVACI